MSEKEDKKQKLETLEADMNSSDFWTDKNKAQATIKMIADLKTELSGGGKYDSGDAILTILSGAGGDDAEDFSKMLLLMYCRFFDKMGWGYKVLDENENPLSHVSVAILGRQTGIITGDSGTFKLKVSADKAFAIVFIQALNRQVVIVSIRFAMR